MNTDVFEPIGLNEMNKVTLMNRIDRKYWFHAAHLETILHSVSASYYLLSMDGQNGMTYATTYFDTEHNSMYLLHHNGKLNRYKIRKRSYVDSGIGFLEIKFKNNKGRTIKKRIPTDYAMPAFTESEVDFIQTHTPFNYQDLAPSLINKFRRLTLVNKNFKERCTIDINLQFVGGKKTAQMEHMVIVEIKSDGHGSRSPLALALRDMRIKSAGFSKYCMGRTISEPDLKHNAFKPKLRRIKRLLTINKKVS